MLHRTVQISMTDFPLTPLYHTGSCALVNKMHNPSCKAGSNSPSLFTDFPRSDLPLRGGTRWIIQTIMQNLVSIQTDRYDALQNSHCRHARVCGDFHQNSGTRKFLHVFCMKIALT